MKCIYLFCIILCAQQIVSAQINFERTWPLGYGGNIEPGNPDFDGMLMKFTSDTVLVDAQPDIPMLAKPIAFICDSMGNLLLYFNGCMLANGQHEIIENSDSIEVELDFGAQCQESGVFPDAYPNAVILPFPGHPEMYYLFYIQKAQGNGGNNQLLYAVVDMSQNEGAGKVIMKNQPTQTNTVNPLHLQTYINAIRHGNGRDWWVVCPTESTSRPRLMLLLTPEGIQYPLSFPLNPDLTLSSDLPGQCGFTADGRTYFKVVRAPAPILEILDFDRCTGLFSNRRLIANGLSTELEPVNTMIGAVSSPSGQFLYVSTGSRLLQFDLWADSIAVTMQVVGQYDGFQSGGNPAMFGHGMRGPDGKIYLGGVKKIRHLHIVQQPDLSGASCAFEQHALEMPAYLDQVMLNFPDFEILDWAGSPCDTLLPPDESVSTQFEPSGNHILKVWPNPATDIFNLDIPDGFQNAQLTILNISGFMVFSRKIENGGTQQINLQQQPEGLYCIVLSQQSGYYRFCKLMLKR